MDYFSTPLFEPMGDPNTTTIDPSNLLNSGAFQDAAPPQVQQKMKKKNDSVSSTSDEMKFQESSSACYEPDEDEVLLASEEGKKLTSKQRRQLRNKVSARHFRLRRKEYISHLESLVSEKSSVIDTLKRELDQVKQENSTLHAQLSSTSPQSTSSSSSSSFQRDNQSFSDASSINSTNSVVSAEDILDRELSYALEQSESAHQLNPVINDSPALSFGSNTPSPLTQQQSPPVNDIDFSSSSQYQLPDIIFSSVPSYNTTNINNNNNTSSSSSSSSSIPDWSDINPRLGTLLTTRPVPKDVNPNKFDWPLYSEPATNSPFGNKNMDIFNTIIPESLSELEKEEENNNNNTPRPVTITVPVVSSKPDVEEEEQGKAQDDEGIWEDARKAAEEVYKRLGVQIQSLSLESNEQNSSPQV